MAKAPAKRRSRTRRPPPPPSWTEVTVQKVAPFKTLLLTLSSMIGAVIVLFSAYKFLGLPEIITDRALHATVSAIEQKIDNSHASVVSLANKNKEEVQTNVGKVETKVDGLAKQLETTNTTMLETQKTTLWTQKKRIVDAIQQMEAELVKTPNDQNIIIRRNEYKDYMAALDKQIDVLNDKIMRAH